MDAQSDPSNASLHVDPWPNASCVAAGPAPYGPAQLALLATAAAALSLLTVLGNLLVLAAVALNRRLRTVHNYFLLSLAAADLLVGVVSMNLYWLYELRGSWPLGAAACDLWLVLDRAVGSASVLHLLLISLDRYLCVTRPLSWPARRGGRAAALMVAAAWLLPLALWAPVVLRWQWGGGGRRLVPPGCCYTRLLASPAATLATTLPTFYLPAALMVALYWRLSVASRRRQPSAASSGRDFLLRRRSWVGSAPLSRWDSGRRRPVCVWPAGGASGLQRHENQNQNQAEVGGASAAGLARRRRRLAAARERRVSRTLAAVLLAFILTWSPYNVLAAVAAFRGARIPAALWSAAYWLCYVNSAVNPGCYALCNATFRKTFRSLLRCG